ncbi:MAG: LysM peptidoglycan-binding domain-containing protein [Ruminococcus sp.]|nr:LysM peptidoglycan-binding domain-containing protein [Ruminococcus sp.]
MKTTVDILSDKKEPPGNNYRNGTCKQTYVTYVIQPGDTLQGLAEKFDTTCQTLLALNRFATPPRLYRGNTLRIPENCEKIFSK